MAVTLQNRDVAWQELGLHFLLCVVNTFRQTRSQDLIPSLRVRRDPKRRDKGLGTSLTFRVSLFIADLLSTSIRIRKMLVLLMQPIVNKTTNFRFN